MIELRIMICLVARSFKINAMYQKIGPEADGSGKGTKWRKVEIC